VAIETAALVVSGELSRLEAGAGAVALALTLDLVVVVPLGFYLLVVRRLRLPLVLMAPAFLLSVLAASRILPADRQQALHFIEVAMIPAELGLIGWIGTRAAIALRRARGNAAADPLEQLRRAALELTGNDRVSGILATEIAVLVYGLGSWRARPHAPGETTAFTHHRRSGQGRIVFAFLLIMAIEAFAVHLLLLVWSATAAWIFTIGTAYAALWLLADYRATVLRPILIDEESLLVRAGLRCTLRVPRVRLAASRHEKPELGKECLNLTLLGAPTHWLVFSERVTTEGPYGFRRGVRAIGIQPDEPEDLERILARGSPEPLT